MTLWTHRMTQFLLGSLAIGALVWSCSDPGKQRPNVLIITLDTTRADRLGCYGATAASTRTIDALAKTGARFERAISTAGLTPMSHASILTGLNNYRHGLRVFYSQEAGHVLKDEVHTLPELLAPRGWHTAAFTSAYPVSRAYGLDQGFQTFDSGVDASALDLTSQQRHETEWADQRETATQRRGDATTDAALAWLSAQSADQPWCMWMHYFDAHDYSLVPPTDWAAARGITYPAAGSVQRRDQLQWRERMYDPELTFIDEQIARVLQKLVAMGVDERTLVVITADHGQGLSDGLRHHGWMKHRLIFDWGVHVPLILHGPGVEPRVIAEQVRTTDIVPTLLELLDVPAQDELDGASLVALMRGEKEATPRLAYSDALNLLDAHSPRAGALPPGQYDNLYALQDGRWKFVWHQQDEAASELYDLVTDPAELDNLYAPDHPEAKRLAAQLAALDPSRVEAPADNGADPNAEALQSLGYGGEDFGPAKPRRDK
ncbi:MAG: sulfatase [Planctomycetota bacterium]